MCSFFGSGTEERRAPAIADVSVDGLALCQLVLSVDQVGKIGELDAQILLVFSAPLRLVINHVISFLFHSDTSVG